MSRLERFFAFSRRGTTLSRDTFAGMTTFVVMSCIIFVNPSIFVIPLLQDHFSWI